MSITENSKDSTELQESLDGKSLDEDRLSKLLEESAKRYVKMGYYILPCQNLETANPKRPQGELVPNGVKDASNDVKTVEEWWKTKPYCYCNIGIAGGHGLIIIDLDVKDDKDGVANLTRIAGDAGVSFSEDADVPFPQGWIVARTQSDGYHLYFRCENSQDYPNRARIMYQDKETGIDIRTDGGYVLAAPSMIKASDTSANFYEWVEGRELVPVKDLPELPKWLADILPKKQPVTTGKPLESLNKPIVNTGISATDKDSRISAYIGTMDQAIAHQNGSGTTIGALGRLWWGFALTEDELRQYAQVYNTERCDPPWSESALKHKIESVLNRWKPRDGRAKGHLLAEERADQWGGGDSDAKKFIQPFLDAEAAKTKFQQDLKGIPAMSEMDDNSPLDIPFDELHKDEEFPLDAFPNVMQRYIRSVAESMNVPERMVALPLLVEMAGVIGSTKELEIYDSRYLKLSLWGMYVAEPGEKKTPVLNEIKTLISDHEVIAREEYNKALYAYNVEKEKFDRAYKKGAVAIEAMPTAPKSESILIGKATIEAVFDRISHNTRGVLIMRDELGGLVQGLDQYKKGKGDDLDMLLELYDGSDIAVDTKTAGGAFIRDCTCSVFGGTQPKRFESLFHTEANIDSGFFSRFIPLWIPEADCVSTSKPIDAKAKKNMCGTVDNLWLLEKETYQRKGKNFERPDRILLDDVARTLFKKEEDFYQKMKKSAATSEVKGVISKIAARSAKIAAIFFLVEYADTLRQMPEEDNEATKATMNKPSLGISENWMKKAIRLNFWFAKTVYRWLTDSEEYETNTNNVKGIETEITLLLKSGDVSKRNIDRKYQSAAGKQAVRRLLDSHVIVTVVKNGLTSRGGRNTTYYALATS